MLSTENPPPDPSSELKNNGSSSNIGGDERVSEVDLFKSLPKFSIRDYVYNTRSKDIETHWPFSAKNLQLCLKHGVKDVLPPFQTLDSVRNPSTVRCAVENISNSDVKLSRSSDCVLPVPTNNVDRELALDVENNKLSGSEEDKEYPLTATSQSCSNANSVLVTNSPSEAENLGPVSNNKFESNIQNQVKKGKLIVRLSNVVEPKSKEELTLHSSAVSETMASKVCPVCKTFSSSSNTTLNAHIDQCLSGESTVKWTTNSKVIKHRIKPRKTRLIVDIYETAAHYTLEDLDRRNGTNWSSNLGFPAHDLDACAEETNNTLSSVNVEDNKEEGAVYVDSNGTKVRILSKFSDLPSTSNVKEDSEHRKLIERDKGSKFIPSKKKKYLVQKLKLLNPSYGQRSCSPRPDCRPEVNNGEHRKFPPEKAYEKEDLAHPPRACDKVKSDDYGMIKQWVGSKRTGLRKKINAEDEIQHGGKVVKNLRLRSSLSSQGDQFIKRKDLSSPTLYDENPLISPESGKSTENFSLNSHDEYMEQPRLRKRAAFSSLESGDFHGKKNHPKLSKGNVKQSIKDGPAVQHYPNPLDTAEKHAYSGNNKKIRISIISTVNADGSLISPRMSSHHDTFPSGSKQSISLKKSSSDHAILSGGKKFSSLRKNLLSVRHTSVLQLKKKKLGSKGLDFKKRKLHYMSGSDEEVVVPLSASHRQDNLAETPMRNASPTEKASAKSSIDNYKVLRIRKKKGGFVNTGKEGGPEKSPESNSYGVGKKIDSFADSTVPDGFSNAVEEVEFRDENVCEPTSNIADGEAYIAFGRSLDPEFPVAAGLSGVDCAPEHYMKAYEEQVSGGEREMFSPEKVSKDFATSNAQTVTEVVDGRGNYFVDVDPIPIPGPPGSFLPSPGRMSSEELQGNSSLTTCKLHSSEDEHELVDKDSSDSPVSATSILSEGKKKLDDSRQNLLSPESPPRFSNREPCCCSRKEGVLESGSLNYQDSQLLWRRTMTSVPPPTQDKQIDGEPKTNLYGFNLRSKVLPPKELTPEPEIGLANSPVGYNAAILVSHSSESKFPTFGDCESLSPSTSNPVLRLMGKNLMVVNKEENLSPQMMPTQSSMVNQHIDLKACLDNGVSNGNLQNHHLSFISTVSHGLPTFSNVQTCLPPQQFGFSSLDGFRNHANIRPPEFCADRPTVMHSSNSFVEYSGGSHLTPDQLGSTIRLKSPVTHEVEKVRTPIPQHRLGDSCGGAKEIIVIDDSPENEANFGIRTMHSGESFSTSMVKGFESRHGNPLYNYQTWGYPICSGPQMVQHANIHVSPSKGMNGNLGKWNCIGEGSYVPHPTGHVRSPPYFSPGFP